MMELPKNNPFVLERFAKFSKEEAEFILEKLDDFGWSDTDLPWICEAYPPCDHGRDPRGIDPLLSECGYSIKNQTKARKK